MPVFGFNCPDPVPASDLMNEVLACFRLGSGQRVQAGGLVGSPSVEVLGGPEGKKQVEEKLLLMLTSSQSPLEKLQVALLLRDVGHPLPNEEFLGIVEQLRGSIPHLQDPKQLAWAKLLAERDWNGLLGNRHPKDLAFQK